MKRPGRINQAAFSYYPRLERVKRYLEGHLSEALPLDKAARIAGLERSYFSAFFHRKTGICFKDWNSYLRVRRAMDLLERRDRSITDTAFAVGFSDLRTFERAFKRWTGTTATRYKRSVRPS